MSSFVLDTSVTVAWYLPEAFADPARGWQARMLEERVHFIVPTLHYWEFANVLRTHLRSRTLDAKLADDIWALHLDAPLQVVEPPSESVLALALEYETTAYDAVYIALAIHLDVPVLTAERSSTPWVRKMGKRAHTILQ
jgi:predicted nucleic acid-binding protein